MKTGKLILFILCVLFSFNEAKTQTFYYYNTTQTFFINQSCTYQCDIRYGAVVLYNQANQFTYQKPMYKNGSPLEPDHWVNIDDVQPDTWTLPLARSIVSNAFTSDEKSRFKGEPLGITMIISPETGKVIEVNFDFNPTTGYATVPVTTYRQIELNLKSQIYFTPTSEGKKVNYLMRFWMQKVK